MKHIFKKIKRKVSPKPPSQPIRPEEPADIAAGPHHFRAEVDDVTDGGQNLSYEGLEADPADLTVPPGEGGEMGLQTVFQVRTGGNQELPASGASTLPITIGDHGYRNQPASKCS